MRIKATETAALAIDFQERLIPVIFERDEIVKKTVILLKGLKALNVPFVITRQYPKGLGDTLPEIRELTCDSASFDKLSFSAVGESEPQLAFKELKRKNIIICGVEAHICVLQSLLDLKAAGFHPVLVADCIGSRFPGNKEIAIHRAIQEGATVTTAESILFELTERAGTDTFKLISKLIK